MIEKELIKRVCDVTCSKEDVVRPQDTIAYDPNNPFKKYYHIESIIMAINKYASHEWDDQTLAHWACIYCWILCGGFKNVKEKLNSLEQFLKDDITWSLDGLSFFDESYFEEDAGPADLIEAYKTIDYI